MNEAASTAPVIDHDGAAALMEPLTDLVIRAGTAILAVNRRAMKIDGKVDGSPVTEADLAADRIIERPGPPDCRSARAVRGAA
jgi:3'(2'), 5'-bisphosphate nucleotidase